MNIRDYVIEKLKPPTKVKKKVAHLDQYADDLGLLSRDLDTIPRGDRNKYPTIQSRAQDIAREAKAGNPMAVALRDKYAYAGKNFSTLKLALADTKRELVARAKSPYTGEQLGKMIPVHKDSPLYHTKVNWLSKGGRVKGADMLAKPFLRKTMYHLFRG